MRNIIIIVFASFSIGFLARYCSHPDPVSVHLVENADSAQSSRDTLIAVVDTVRLQLDTALATAQKNQKVARDALTQLKIEKGITDSLAKSSNNWVMLFHRATSERDTALAQLDSALARVDTLIKVVKADSGAFAAHAKYVTLAESRIDSLETQLKKSLSSSPSSKLFGLIPLPDLIFSYSTPLDPIRFRPSIGLGYRIRL